MIPIAQVNHFSAFAVDRRSGFRESSWVAWTGLQRHHASVRDPPVGHPLLCGCTPSLFFRVLLEQVPRFLDVATISTHPRNAMHFSFPCTLSPRPLGGARKRIHVLTLTCMCRILNILMFWALDYFLPKRLDPTLANFVKAGEEAHETMQSQLVTEILLCFVWSMCQPFDVYAACMCGSTSASSLRLRFCGKIMDPLAMAEYSWTF